MTLEFSQRTFEKSKTIKFHENPSGGTDRQDEADSCSAAVTYVSHISYKHHPKCGPGSSVVIVTDYGLDGLGPNPGGDEIFHPYRPALGPTQPPVQCVLGGKVQSRHVVYHSPPSSSTVMEE